MIVKKPIGAVKINGIVSRLTVGKPVPGNVFDFWKETGQLKDLKEAGIIGEAENGSAGSNKKKDTKGITKDDLVFKDEE